MLATVKQPIKHMQNYKNASTKETSVFDGSCTWAEWLAPFFVQHKPAILVCYVHCGPCSPMKCIKQEEHHSGTHGSTVIMSRKHV